MSFSSVDFWWWWFIDVFAGRDQRESDSNTMLAHVDVKMLWYSSKDKLWSSDVDRVSATFAIGKLAATTDFSPDDEPIVNGIRRDSETTGSTDLTINNLADQFHVNSLTSSQSSDVNVPSSSLSMIAMTSKQSLFVPLTRARITEKKSKHGVRHFLRRIFRSQSQQARESKVEQPPNNVHRPRAVSSTTSRPIRLFVIRHGERLDRYYSSQWLRQAFDQDGHYCRFSPILP